MVEVDTEKVQLLLTHLSRANMNIREKLIAEGRLEEQVKEVKKLAKGKEFKDQVKELERRIGQALEAEKKILVRQHATSMVHTQVLKRIEQLDKKLERYLRTGRQRTARIHYLERKIREGAEGKRAQVEVIEEQIRLLEHIYERIRKEGGYPEADLLRIENKIALLKERVGKLKT